MGKETHSVVMWSGGTDSTYLVLNRLLSGGSVTGLYVSVLNNETKTVAELAAIRRMCGFFEKMFPRKFTFNHVAKIDITAGTFLLKQPLLWMLPAAYFTSVEPDKYNEVCIGYILKDDAISWLEDFKQIWKSLESLTLDGLPTLTFPLSKVPKSDLKLPEELEACRVFCECPTKGEDDYKSCGRCEKCLSEKVAVSDDDFLPKLSLVLDKVAEEPDFMI